MALLPVEDAQEQLIGGTAQMVRSQTIPLSEARRRVLSEPVISRLTQPPFTASAMDGYALRGADVAVLDTQFRVIGQSAAGHAFQGQVGKAEAVRIFTGAPMPDGADTVLLQEDATVLGDGRITNRFSPETGRHVRPRGQDFLDGEAILKPGDVLDAGRLTVAAGMNQPSVTVYRKPLVAIIATGDELVDAGQHPGPNQIIASSLYGVAALAEAAGAEILQLGIVGDSQEAIAARIAQAQQAGADVLVTLGGASVGDHDLVQSTLTGLGMRLDFWKIAMRPGKPLMVGSLGEMRVLGLPGNPVSSLVCGILFLEPLVAHMARLAPPERRAKAVSALALAANDHRQDYLRATLSRDESDALTAHSFGKQDSSQMKIFANSDCLIIRKPNAAALAAGETCDILHLRF